MNFDYYASLAGQKPCPKKVNEGALSSGFADGCVSNFAMAEIDRAEAEQREKKAQKNSQEEKDAGEEKKAAEKRKNDARRCYMKRASALKSLELPPDLKLEPGSSQHRNFDPDFSRLPDPSWFGIEVGFELLSPWYSKDDRPFYVLDNPVRKDRVFGVPFMSAASWKGLLRWAFKMRTGLIDLGDNKLSDKDNKLFKMQEVFLFGNERAEGEDFSRGALMFYPTWFDQVGFEAINPHKRKTRAGTKPIYYEVVPAERKGSLRLLYAPLPGEIDNDKVKPVDAIASLIDGIKTLLETYGISAKRTAGWGAAKVNSCCLHLVEGSWFAKDIGTETKKEFVSPKEEYKKLMDENGRAISVLLDENEEILSKTQFKKLRNRKPDCTNAEFVSFKEWYEKHGEEYRMNLNPDAKNEQLPTVVERKFNTLADFRAALKKPENIQKGGG